MFKIYIYFLISIIIHELAHLFVAKIFKIRLKNLRVSIFGASLEMEKNVKNKYILKIIMYLAGPVANLLFAIIIFKFKIDNEQKLKIIYTNLSIFAFNLLPILPLDGGNILIEILKQKFDYLQANKISLFISKISLGLLTFIYSIAIVKIKNISFLFLLAYLWYLSFTQEKKIELLERTYSALRKNLKYNNLKKIRSSS